VNVIGPGSRHSADMGELVALRLERVCLRDYSGYPRISRVASRGLQSPTCSFQVSRYIPCPLCLIYTIHQRKSTRSNRIDIVYTILPLIPLYGYLLVSHVPPARTVRS
jgi:hypothetical protein